jgi:chaperonin GroEL (HSP60 family)
VDLVAPDPQHFNFLRFSRFAQALEVIPRVLAENSGVKPKEVISKLYAAHSEGNKNVGFDIEGESGDVKVRATSYFSAVLWIRDVYPGS